MKHLPNISGRNILYFAFVLTAWFSFSANIASLQQPALTEVEYPVLFISRQIPNNGSIYWSVPNDMPGVGAHSRFRLAAPGKLQVRQPDGNIVTLIDGSNPTPASLQLIDVNAPDVSFDGTQIVFAGLPAGSYNPNPVNNPNAWRIYKINIDGTGLTQLTYSDEGGLNLSQFGEAAGSLGTYDDTDPVWLPDGRIVFVSTRYRSYAHYSGVRTTNLFVINPDGSNLHRITTEKNGADRPIIDPITGKIVFARWWRNHRFAVNDLSSVEHGLSYPAGGYEQHNGLTTSRDDHVGGGDNLWRNAWHAATINPDGTNLAMWSGFFRNEDANHIYGGAFTPEGELIANYFPMINMTEAAGFGGLRRYTRGSGLYQGLAGITYLTLNYASYAPVSYGIFTGSYAAEPDVLPDGRIIFSFATDYYQDYGLYIMNPDGSNPQLLYDQAGTTELRAKTIRPRPLPPIVAAQVNQVADPLPPLANGPYDSEGTFIFDCLNVYSNAPVDVDIVSAPPIGSAKTIRFFIDHQRTSPGSFPNLDWPVLLKELPVSPEGRLVDFESPANVPLFEQLRGQLANGYTVPTTGGPFVNGAAHVAGMNYGRPNTEVRCVGCHAGHTLIPLPPTLEDAKWTNLAPGAALQVSSARDPDYINGLIDRRVMKGDIWRYWNSAVGQTANQWVQLTFPDNIIVRSVVLYNPRFGDEANSTLQVQAATVQLFADEDATIEVASQTTGPLAVSGTPVSFPDVLARSVRVWIDASTGTFYGAQLVALAEVEVIGKGVTTCSFTPEITGTTIICTNSETYFQYSVEQVPGSVYIWTVNGGNIISGQGSHQITVQWNDDAAGFVSIEQLSP